MFHIKICVIIAFLFMSQVNIVSLFQNQMWLVQFGGTGPVPSDNVWCDDSEFLLIPVCDVIPRAVFQECVLRQWPSPSTSRWDQVSLLLEAGTLNGYGGDKLMYLADFHNKGRAFCCIVSKHPALLKADSDKTNKNKEESSYSTIVKSVAFKFHTYFISPFYLFWTFNIGKRPETVNVSSRTH